MSRSRSDVVTVVLGGVLLVAVFTPLGARAQLVKPEEVVHITTALPQSGFVAGATFQAAVVVDILDGYHLNAHGVKDPTLIPTDLELPEEGPVTWPFVRYPEDRAAPGVPVQGLVGEQYQGRIVIRLIGRLPDDAAPGPLKVAMKLHYQACTDLVCLIPYGKGFELEIPVVAPGTRVEPRHPEIFGQRPVPPEPFDATGRDGPQPGTGG